jgi:hypothetical protein
MSWQSRQPGQIQGRGGSPLLPPSKRTPRAAGHSVGPRGALAHLSGIQVGAGTSCPPVLLSTRLRGVRCAPPRSESASTRPQGAATRPGPAPAHAAPMTHSIIRSAGTCGRSHSLRIASATRSAIPAVLSTLPTPAEDRCRSSRDGATPCPGLWGIGGGLPVAAREIQCVSAEAAVDGRPV